MKRYLVIITCSAVVATVGITSETTNQIVKPDGKTMSAPSVSLGYVILYVKDVSASLAFYEKAFGLSRRFFNDDNGKAYGELETGAARLAAVPAMGKRLGMRNGTPNHRADRRVSRLKY